MAGVMMAAFVKACRNRIVLARLSYIMPLVLCKIEDHFI